VADSLIRSLRRAGRQRIDQGWKEELEIRAIYAPWIDADPAVVHDKVGLKPIANPPQGYIKEALRAADDWQPDRRLL
jgi:hypothetical protein